MLASVVTPVCRTPLALFKEAFHSLLAQTCGFERIEWLVAIHNMDDAYEAALREITENRKNILFLRVNHGRSPSLPRNLCVERASTPYVFFLDSDDLLAPDCIEKTVAAMEQTRAEIAVFSCALFTGSESELMRRIFCVNAPVEELLVYERGDPRILSLMAEWGAMLWSRAYRRELLQQSGLRMDESVRIGEDLLFNLSLTPLAERICVLPLLTGCAHREWSGSLLQSELPLSAEGEQILRYLPAIQNEGASELRWYHLSWFAKKILHHGSDAVLTPRILDALTPVFNGMRVMAPRFSYTRERIAGMLRMCSALLPIPTAPRLRQQYESLNRSLSEEALRRQAAAAAAENVELRTVGTEGLQNPFLGVESPDAMPELCILDLQHMNDAKQETHMESYRRMEMLRGFQNGSEVHCRVTLFRLSPHRCTLSITWDDRFVGEQGIDRLRYLICGNPTGIASF